MSDLDDADLVRLGHLNLLEFTRESVRWSGRDGEVVERDGLLLVAGATPFPVVYNAVARLDPGVPGPEVLAAADAFFGARRRGYSAMVSGHDGVDDDLAAAAQAAGHVRVTDAPQLVVTAPVDPPSPTDGVELVWVGDEEAAAAWMAVGAASFASLGLPEAVALDAMREPARLLEPHIHAVLACDGGEPVAAAMTLLSHGIAGVYWVATLDRARGRGLGEVVTRAVTNRAFEAGAVANSLQASPMGEAIYRRMGYRELHRVAGYVRFDPPPAP